MSALESAIIWVTLNWISGWIQSLLLIAINQRECREMNEP